MPQTKTALIQPIPFLHFTGECLHAMRFYERTLGGEIDLLMTYGGSPFKDNIPPELHERVMNARLKLPGGGTLYGGDAIQECDGIKGLSLTLSFETTTEAEQTFQKLAEEGTVTMPIGPTFAAETFGMVTDKYGIDWMIMGVSLL